MRPPARTKEVYRPTCARVSDRSSRKAVLVRAIDESWGSIQKAEAHAAYPDEFIERAGRSVTFFVEEKKRHRVP